MAGREPTMTFKRTRRPTSPGEILFELYLAPHNVPIAKFADAVGVTRKHVSAIVHGRASITAETATRISAVLGTTAQYWLNLQNAIDLYDAQERLAESESLRSACPSSIDRTSRSRTQLIQIEEQEVEFKPRTRIH